MPRLYALALLFALLPACDDDDNDDAQSASDAEATADASKTDAADKQDAQQDAQPEDASQQDAEQDAQPEDSSLQDAEQDAQPEDSSLQDAEQDAQPEDSSLQDAEQDASDCPYLCGGSTPICSNGQCVQCVTKDDCANENDECVQNQCRAPLTCDHQGFTVVLDQLRLIGDGGLAYNAFTAFPESGSSFDNLRVLLIDPSSLQAASYSIADTPREQNYQTCERCILAYAQCSQMNLCQKVFMATGGLMEVEQIGTQIGQQVKLRLSDLTFEEVTIDQQSFISQAVENGEHWCIDQLSINKYINSDTAECNEDTECTTPGKTHCDKGACVECTEKEHCDQGETCKFNACVDEKLENWICDDDWYEDGDCNCGCGAPDPDCADNTRASCKYILCEYTGGSVYIDRNWLCIPQCTAETESEICPADLPHCRGTHCAECINDDHCPGDDRCLNEICGNCTSDDDCNGRSCLNHHCQAGEWTCPESYYGDGECDCGCGVKDVDCADGSLASCQTTHSCSTQPIDGQNWLCEPECTTENQSSHCSAPTPYCSAENTCVQCTQRSHCSDPTPVCTTDNRCVQCTGDEDCATGTCNTTTNRCVTGDCDYTGYSSCTYGSSYSYSTTDGVKGHCYTNVTYSSQILIELYNEAIAPGSYTLQGGDYDSSNYAVFIYDIEGSNPNYYYATEGTLVIESVSANAMTGHIQNAKLKEINGAPRGNIIGDGRVWCLDRYDFSFSTISK